MSKLKIAELFYSIQGEGRYIGVPSVFLRTFGCNFKCAGFGMPKGQVSHEATDIAATHSMIKAFTKYEELPLVAGRAVIRKLDLRKLLRSLPLLAEAAHWVD